MAFTGAKKREHNRMVAESEEGQRKAAFRKTLQRDRMRYAEAYWKFRLIQGRTIEGLIKGCSPECIEQARLNVMQKMREPVEVVEIK